MNEALVCESLALLHPTPSIIHICSIYGFQFVMVND